MNRLDVDRERIERWFREALKAVDPRESVRRSLVWDGAALSIDGRDVPLLPDARLVVIAVGKAAPAMARGAHDVLGERIDTGVVLTKAGNPDLDVDDFRVFEASHPTPDERGVTATREVVEAVSALSWNDVVLALISGGGSALLEMPREGISLDDIRATTTTLMHAGAGIHDLNAVRQALSEVKGGGLRGFIGPATCITLLLSDVLGNDPHVIASGPTVPLPSDAADPTEVVRRFGVADILSDPVRDAMTRYAPVSPVVDERDVVSVIAENATLVREIERIVIHDGLRPEIAWRAFDGDANDLGRTLVAATRCAPDGIDVLLGGGEATIQVGSDGKGGRNTEAALVAAIAMPAESRWLIASLASDGDDGMADAAGAIADARTVDRGRAAGCDAALSLANNDSATCFAEAGGLVQTGPTGTNVNDVYIAVRRSDGMSEEQQ